MRIQPRRRSYADRPAGRESTPDSSEQVRDIGVVIICGGVGFLWLGPLGLILGTGLGFVTTRLLLHGVSRLVAGSLLPDGSTTAYKRQYSIAEAAAAGGDLTGAIAEYTKHVLEDPTDPEPYLRIARIYRDQLQEYPLAISWLRRARTEGGATAGQDLLVTQDLIEIYVHKTREPRKAIPELAHLVDRFPTTPAAASAKAELERLRALLKVEQDEWESLTGRFYKEREEGSE